MVLEVVTSVSLQNCNHLFIPMYNRSSNRDGNSSRNSFNNRGGYGGGGSRFGGGNSRFGGGRGYGGGGRYPRRRPPGQNIDVSRFINKVTELTTPPEYVSTHKFSDFNMHEKLKQNVAARGFVHPTPIQDQSIPQILEGKDLVGLANTGTGKTGAFLLPLLNKVYSNKSEKVLIMAPTRELAVQIRDEFKEFSKGMGIYATICIGGANIRPQMYELRRNPQFVIGTPGRLKDLAERRCLNLASFSNIVLDEVDRMLDMGFVQDIKAIIAQLRPERQSLFFSATTTPEINTLINTILKDPIMVSVKSRDTSANIDQDIVRIENKSRKIETLHDILNKEEVLKVLIFGQTKRGVEKLTNELIERGFKAVSIHGDKPQFQRQKALGLFKQDHATIMVATDVAARGLDIPDVTHVINYELPQTYEDYVHRIGRTGRANKKGTALTFVE